MNKARIKKTATFVVRWGIAVFGIYYVLSNISMYDRVMILGLGPDKWPESYKLAQPGAEGDSQFYIATGPIPREKVLVRTEPSTVHLHEQGEQRFDVMARKLSDDPDRARWPLVVVPHRNLWQRFWNKHTGSARVVAPGDVIGEVAKPVVPYPAVDIGMSRMLHEAQWLLLLAGILVFPLTFVMTAYRWHALLEALEIHISFARTFTLTMVGAFYNTFMPGSTGGDVLKAYYASKQTHHRTRSVMSVVVDRIIGLIALIIVGGIAAATQWWVPACKKIALGSGAIILCVMAGLFVYYTPGLRKGLGLDFIIDRLPKQKQLRNAMQVMDIYRRRAGLILWALVVSFPVHATVVLSAMLACNAFNLPIHWPYYWVIVPVIVLAGAIPISPQGAGVMEAFAIVLTRNHGCTPAQAFVLAMAVRMVQIIWNLAGGLLVFRGGYHAPTAAEQAEGAAEEAV